MPTNDNDCKHTPSNIHGWDEAEIIAAAAVSVSCDVARSGPFMMGRHLCESPIESTLFTALYAMGTLTGDLVCQGATPSEYLQHEAKSCFTTHFSPQVVVGNYRVDFLFAIPMLRNRVTLLAVECDGHDFHEKTKEQAARDKARDRDLTELGIRVIRFTGSEIWRDPVRCAADVMRIARTMQIAGWQSEAAV